MNDNVELIIRNCKTVRDLIKDSENQPDMSIELFNIGFGKTSFGEGYICSSLYINCNKMRCELDNHTLDGHDMSVIDFHELNEEYQNRVNHLLEQIIKNSKIGN